MDPLSRRTKEGLSQITENLNNLANLKFYFVELGDNIVKLCATKKSY